MAERPILFSGPMVRAILAGTKAQTRRPMKVQPTSVERWKGGATTGDTRARHATMRDASGKGWASCGPFTPPCKVDDLLWVRECWRVGGLRDREPLPPFDILDRGYRSPMPGRIAVDYRATPEVLRTPWCIPHDSAEFAILRTQVRAAAKRKGIAEWEPGGSPDKWRPSIHMPRWASRLTLLVTDVRVERLQDISESDACADGGFSRITRDCKVPKFAELWNGAYGAGAWDANPWCWVITFERAHDAPREATHA